MAALDPRWWDVLVFLAILWATTGLTVLHVGILGFRAASSIVRPRKAASRRARQEPAPDLSITFVIPAFNEAMNLSACIESILRQSVRPAAIIVVDDASTDETAKVLARYRPHSVQCIRLPKNGGRGNALQAGLRYIRAYVKTDLVAFTDADSIVHREYSREILESFRDPEVVAACGEIESIPHTWITATRQVEYMTTFQLMRRAESSTRSISVLSGAATTYRTSVLDEMGFHFDSNGEDMDLTFRMHLAKKKFVMNLRAKVYTSDPPTLRAYRRQLWRWYNSFWFLLKKHRTLFGRRYFGSVELPMIVLNMTVASALYLVLPIYLLIVDPMKLVWFAAMGLAMDATLAGITATAYGRRDVWWSVLSRVPTRAISRFTYLHAMVRVLFGGPDHKWGIIERRETSAFLSRLATVDT